MPRATQLLNVIDVEATCWDKKTPAGQTSEIIEIGIAVVELHTRQIVKTHSLLITPGESEVSGFCTQLTTLTQDKLLREGISFPNAIQILKKQYGSIMHPWASWGDYDRNMFTKQCQRREESYPFSGRHLNVKTLYAMQHGLPFEVGLGEALAYNNIPFEGTPHRGIDDARMIATMLLHLWNHHG